MRFEELEELHYRETIDTSHIFLISEKSLSMKVKGDRQLFNTKGDELARKTKMAINSLTTWKKIYIMYN
jgi:hypothetical protein